MLRRSSIRASATPDAVSRLDLEGGTARAAGRPTPGDDTDGEHSAGWNVYALVNPVDRTPFFVGYSKAGRNRIEPGSRDNPERRAVIKALRAGGHRISAMHLEQRASPEEAGSAETFWVELLTGRGARLVNHHIPEPARRGALRHHLALARSTPGTSPIQEGPRLVIAQDITQLPQAAQPEAQPRATPEPAQADTTCAAASLPPATAQSVHDDRLDPNAGAPASATTAATAPAGAANEPSVHDPSPGQHVFEDRGGRRTIVRLRPTMRVVPAQSDSAPAWADAPAPGPGSPTPDASSPGIHLPESPSIVQSSPNPGAQALAVAMATPASREMAPLRPPRHGKSWDLRETMRMTGRFIAGVEVEALAFEFERSVRSIEARLRTLAAHDSRLARAMKERGMALEPPPGLEA